MIDDKIIEGNKLIAKFMNIETDTDKIDHTLRFKIGDIGMEADELRYSLSWDWLMPVIDKIELGGFGCKITGNYTDTGFLCSFEDFTCTEIIKELSHSTKISTVFIAVVEFIKTFYED